MSLRQPDHLRWCRPRADGGYASDPGDPFGVFIWRRGERVLKILSSPGDDPGLPAGLRGWEHVSVSVADRGGRHRPALPTWEEMCEVRAMFWSPEDVVVQFHPRASEYVNVHPVLHLWRCVDREFPTPATVLV